MINLSDFLTEAYRPGTFNSANDPFFGWCEKKDLLPCVLMKYVRDEGNPEDVAYEIRLVDNDDDLKEMKKARGHRGLRMRVMREPNPRELAKDPDWGMVPDLAWSHCTEVGLFGADPHMYMSNHRDLETWADEIVVGYLMKERSNIFKAVCDERALVFYPNAPITQSYNSKELKNLSIEAYDAKAKSMYNEFEKRMLK